MGTDNSVISPLRISAVEVPETGGLIGMAECPGKNEYTGLGIPVGTWRRELDMDLRVILDWQARILVSLIEDYEYTKGLGKHQNPILASRLRAIFRRASVAKSST